MSEGLLGRMARTSRERAERARGREPLGDLRLRALDTAPAPALRRSAEGFDLIAEVKLRAPSAGVLAAPPDPAAEAARRARAYAEAGAAAISVLTEPTRFDGDLAHLRAAAAASPVPVMRKDFLVDPYQVWQARAAGAGGVLLIVRMVDDDGLEALAEAAVQAGLFALVEAFDRADLERAGQLARQWPEGAPPLLIGVNCRDLVTLDVDLQRLVDLARDLPPGVPAVGESGVKRPDDARRVADAGYAMALVGTALMEASDPADAAASLLDAARGVR